MFCLLAVGLVVALWLLPRTPRADQTSAVYRRYADNENIAASFIKDFRVNDSVTVDVTVLEAKSDTAWTMLKDDYGVPPLSSKSKSDMKKGSPCIAFCKLPELIKNDNRSSEKYTNDNTLVVAMHNDSTIYVFYSKTRERKDAIMDMFIDNYFGL